MNIQVRDCGTLEEMTLPGDTRCVRAHDVSEARDATATATDIDETRMLVNLVVVVRTPRPGASDHARVIYQGNHYTNTLIECVGGTVFVENQAENAIGVRIWRWCEVLGIAPS